MESYNEVHLVGKIKGDASIKQMTGGTETALFQVVTYVMRAGPNTAKNLIEQVHKVALRNCSTIKDSLTDGKSVFVSGRLSYRESGFAYIDAKTVVFTGKRGE